MKVRVRTIDQGCILSVLVTPGASRDELRGEHNGRTKVAVTAPPDRGRANKALCEFLARKLALKRSQVRILAGHTSRQKEVLLERVSPSALKGIIT